MLGQGCTVSWDLWRHWHLHCPSWLVLCPVLASSSHLLVVQEVCMTKKSDVEALLQPSDGLLIVSPNPWNRKHLGKDNLFPTRSNFGKWAISIYFQERPNISTFHRNAVDIHETLGFQQHSKKEKLFTKRQTFCEMCSKDDFSAKVPHICRLRVIYFISLYAGHWNDKWLSSTPQLD